MQRTRCAYFFDPVSACNKRTPGAGCDARDGENRGAAVLGASDACVATHPSDLCVALVAFDAVVEIAGPSGRREMALDAFYRLPGDTPETETELRPGELIVAVRLPADAAGFAKTSRYVKARDRVSYAFALASAAAALRLDGGVIAEARVALGGVAPKPWRAREAEAALRGRTPSDEVFAAAAAAAFAEAKPLGDSAFRIELGRRVVARALRLAAAATTRARFARLAVWSQRMTDFALSLDAAHARHGSNSGQPLTRLDGPLKVTGRAPYAADRRPDGLLYAVMAVATISRGRVKSLDVAAAKAHPGVVEVMTAENRPQDLCRSRQARPALQLLLRGPAEPQSALRPSADRRGHC